MRNLLKRSVKKAFSALGYEIRPKRWSEVAPAAAEGYDEDFMPLYASCQAYTMTSNHKMHALFRAVRYIVDNEVPGSIVECGVAAGGSMMMAASTLLDRKSDSRDLYLFDTFAGMPPPDEKVDVNVRGDSAMLLWKAQDRGDRNDWCHASLDEVKANMARTGYPAARIHYVPGKVQDTTPAAAPPQIALLRLDTDWYDSTRHELEHLYPRLVPGGVLIVDDFGQWQGCRKAVEEWRARVWPVPLLDRIDRLGVIAVKPGFTTSRPE